MEITSPITAIANNVAKAMFTPLLSSESSPQFVSAKNNIHLHSQPSNDSNYIARYIQCRSIITYDVARKHVEL